jgi:hypothetical protein
LEERIAELEATTARKGNRKVSVTVSGFVSQAVFFWDDGREQNVYVGTNSLEQDRFRFVGEAKISDRWSAGYTLEIGIYGVDSKSFSQTSSGTNPGPVVRKSNWWIKSKDYGKIQVGLDGTATYHLLDDADFTQTRSVSDALAAGVYVSAFQTLSHGIATGLKWTEIMRGFDNSTPGQSARRSIVKYYSPEFQGFTVVAAWGGDDLWDAAAIYENDIGDFSVHARAGYGESTDETSSGTNCGGPADNFKCRWWGAAATVQHNPTGLFVFAGWGQQSIDTPGLVAGADNDSSVWFVQPGIEKKWNDLGKTTLFAEYRHDDAGSNITSANVLKTQSGDLDFWSGGVIQGIDSADMMLYVQYRRADGDYTDPLGNVVSLDTLQEVITGAKIAF